MKRKLNESEKVELKRDIYIQRAYLLSNDSITGQTLNPEFEAIDRNYPRKQVMPLSRIEKHQENQLKQLLNGQKIELKNTEFLK